METNEHKCFIISYSAMKASTNTLWYFASGCSRHMARDMANLKDTKSYFKGRVTFGDGKKKEKVTSKNTLNIEYFPNIKNAFLVQGLKTNLISISQLCDQGLHVKFNKDS